MELFVGTAMAVAFCLGLSWFWWRRYPESELFVLGLLASAAVWVGSSWLAVALGI